MNPLQRALIGKAGHDNGFEHVLSSAGDAVGLAWVMLLLARVRWRWVCVSGGVRGFRGRSQGRFLGRFLILVRCLAGRLGRVARRRGRVRL